jgi:alpha-glucan,water dikinase
VVVKQNDDGSQDVHLSTNVQAGRLLLHWGVEGGPNYRGGWRLPGGACRPEGTVQYKDRALQTPFR